MKTTAPVRHFVERIALCLASTMLFTSCGQAEPMNYTLERPNSDLFSVPSVVVIHNSPVGEHEIPLGTKEHGIFLCRDFIQNRTHQAEVKYAVGPSPDTAGAPKVVVLSVKFDGKDVPKNGKSPQPIPEGQSRKGATEPTEDEIPKNGKSPQPTPEGQSRKGATEPTEDEMRKIVLAEMEKVATEFRASKFDASQLGKLAIRRKMEKPGAEMVAYFVEIPYGETSYSGIVTYKRVDGKLAYHEVDMALNAPKLHLSLRRSPSRPVSSSDKHKDGCRPSGG